MNKLYMVFLGLAMLLVAGCAADVDDELPGQDLPDLPEEPSDPQPVNEETDEDNEESQEQVSQAEADRVIEVESVGLRFNPDVIDVEVGETIEFVYTNTGGSHDFVIPELNVGTDIIGGGQQDSFIVTFDEAGTFEFECSVGTHAAQGMVGEIVVS